jgi:hypothetical protein
MLTQNQQQTIQFITETFEKLNKASEPKKFNLINTNLLLEKTERIKALDREEAEERRIWEHLACDEASRIAKLFREDFDGDDKAVVFDAQNQVKICRQDVQEDGSVYTHHFGRCCIEIRVLIKWNYEMDECNTRRKKYFGLQYDCGGTTYETIDELVSDRGFLERLRTEILA